MSRYNADSKQFCYKYYVSNCYTYPLEKLESRAKYDPLPYFVPVDVPATLQSNPSLQITSTKSTLVP